MKATTELEREIGTLDPNTTQQRGECLMKEEAADLL